MGPSQVLPLPSGALSRARFFQSHGVVLESPARSRSGVRHDDGMVVFAMPLARVRTEAWGCSCLLWTAKDRLIDYAVSAERLRHCRLAVRHGAAEGFLLDKDGAPAERNPLLALRVARRGREYWANWGCVARAQNGRLSVCAERVRRR